MDPLTLHLQKVLKQGPWSIDKNLFILSVIPEGHGPTGSHYIRFLFWLQVNNLPVGFMSETVGKYVGNTVGSFLEYDEKNSSNF